MQNSYERLFRVIKSQTSLEEIRNLKILEIGCGDGGFVAYMLEKGYQIYGADVEFKDGPSLSYLLKKSYIKKFSLKALEE